MPGLPDTPPSNASWDVIPANKPAITKMAADEVPPFRGPLTVVATTARKGPTKAYSMHLLDTDGVTVGCGWRPGPLKISELTEQDFHAEPEVYLGCTRCFRHFTFPSTWMAVEPYAAQDSEASISLSSDTDESVETRRRSSSRKLSEGPRALTRFPPCLKARRQGERAQVPRALIRPPQRTRTQWLSSTRPPGTSWPSRASRGSSKRHCRMRALSRWRTSRPGGTRPTVQGRRRRGSWASPPTTTTTRM